MAKAIFHSLRGEKSALLLIKENIFEFGAGTPVYVPRAAVSGLIEGAVIEIPSGYTIVDMVDTDTGEVRVAKDGSPLKVLKY